MIVGSFFNGDDDMELAGRQHGVYDQALRILVLTCNRYAAFARALLDDAGHPDWGRIESFDHRVLQGCHDLLAAAWRFRNDSRQGRMYFNDAGHPIPAEPVWLDWLRIEVSDWIDRPHMVRAVQIVLTSQNQPVGYLAELELCLGVMDQFNDVPWPANERRAREADLAARAAK